MLRNSLQKKNVNQMQNLFEAKMSAPNGEFFILNDTK